MQKNEWIEEAVEQFRQYCIEMDQQLDHAPDGTLLDVSDEQIMKNFKPFLAEIQKEAMQKQIDNKQNNADYRRCNKCKKK